MPALRVLGRALMPLLMAWAVLQVVGLQPYRLQINRTPSEPEGLYWVDTRVRDPGRGDLVEFVYRCPGDCPVPFSTYPTGTRFLKRVTGRPGDRIATGSDRHEWLTQADGVRRDLGEVLRTTPSGVAIPLHACFDGSAIPDASYYVSGESTVPNSYDSRYFGLVDQAQLIGTARLLWAF